MTDLFQLPAASGQAGTAEPFSKFGLDGNPFPALGLGSGVFYNEHMKAEQERVNEWLARVGQAAPDSTGRASGVPPLAIFGSLGVGKTHLLVTLQRGLAKNPKTPVLRKGLTDEGATRLTVASLFLRYLPFSGQDDEPGSQLLREIVRATARSEADRARILGELDAGSALRVPLGALLRPDADPDAVVWVSRWLRREYTTPLQRAKLGIAGILDTEGQAVRAVADLLRLARAAGLIRVWFVMIDQLEELWREGVVTPSRRARFLTDLRMLIDMAHEGAPIAVLLAWNTTTADSTIIANVGQQIQKDYLALWQRLGPPVDMRPLRADDVWPFAEEYLKEKGVTEAAGQPRARLHGLLKAETPRVIAALRQGGHDQGLFAPRAVLEAWRDAAERCAKA